MEIQAQVETSGTTNTQASGRWQEKMTLTMQQMTENFEKKLSLLNCLSFWIWLIVIPAWFCLVFSAAPLLFYCCVLLSSSVLSYKWHLHGGRQEFVCICANRHMKMTYWIVKRTKRRTKETHWLTDHKCTRTHTSSMKSQKSLFHLADRQQGQGRSCCFRTVSTHR